jgi:hypothetical protein
MGESFMQVRTNPLPFLALGNVAINPRVPPHLQNARVMGGKLDCDVDDPAGRKLLL